MNDMNQEDRDGYPEQHSMTIRLGKTLHGPSREGLKAELRDSCGRMDRTDNTSVDSRRDAA